MPDFPLTRPDQLNEFSQEFATTCFAIYPSWRELAVFNPAEGTLLIEVPSPTHEQRKIRLYTDDEITVEFDLWHAHYGWPDVNNEESFREALALADDFVAERVGVQVWLAGDDWRGSSLIYSDSTELLQQIPPDWDATGITRTYRRSWKGTYDAEEVFLSS